MFSVLLMAGERVHWVGGYQRALHLSKRMGKPMLVLLVSKDCDSCRRLLRTAFRDPVLVRWIDRHLVPVIVTQEFGDYPIELFYAPTTPALFLISPDERFLADPIVGAMDLPRIKRSLSVP